VVVLGSLLGVTAAAAAVVLVLMVVEEEELVKQLESPAPTVNCEEAERVNIGKLRPEPIEDVQIRTKPRYHHRLQVQPRWIDQQPLLGSK
jgi:hypothetical protein